MTLDIGQLLEDAKLIREGLIDAYGFEGGSDENESAELESIDRIIAYFQARYVPPSEPGAYRDARGILESDEPAEVAIRRIRDGDDTMNEVIRRHNKPAL